MNKFFYTILAVVFTFSATTLATAGNPDRQGEAGASQLLLNPWSKSAGLHSLNTANIRGVEAMRVNIAGLSRISKTEFLLSHTRYLEGTDISINAFGFAQRIGTSGAFGVTLMATDLGDIPVTTDDQPEGTGATFSPSLINLGFGYSHTFENKVSVGILFRAVSESTADLSAFGLAIDAGVQYVSGEQDNFKFGIALRNVGTPMTFRGQGLAEGRPNPNEAQFPYTLTYFQRSQRFELPSMLNIGLSYDFIVEARHRITVLSNFTSNSFSQDQIGGGIEYAFNEIFMVRGAYKYEFGSNEDGGVRAPVEQGLSAGVSIEVPLKKDSENTFGLDYAYRVTEPWGGTHNLGVRINL
ncbi:MAG: PorV/PorQ family protein [Bacteroidota bacterium]